MNDRELELQLRGWFAAQVPATETAPGALRASVVEIPRLGRPPVVVLRGGRDARLLAVAAIVAIALAGLLLIGIGRPPVLPVPSASSANESDAPIATDTPTEAAPTPPSDSVIAVYQANGAEADIFLLDMNSGQRTPLTTVPFEANGGTNARLSWSRDRRTITVWSFGDQLVPSSWIDTVTGERTDVPTFLDQASPDGTVGIRRDEDFLVFDRGGNVLRHLALPQSGGLADTGPISPDGSRFVVGGCNPCNFLGKGPDATNRAHLFIVPLDGTAIQSIGNVRTEGGFATLAWSRDGRALTGTLNGIVAADIATGALTNLTSSLDDAHPAWSPDGTRIAYERGSGNARGLYVMDADGTNRIRLTRALVDYGDRLPVWSPDGGTILFSRNEVDSSGFGDLYRVSSNGGTPELVLPNAVAGW